MGLEFVHSHLFENTPIKDRLLSSVGASEAVMVFRSRRQSKRTFSQMEQTQHGSTPHVTYWRVDPIDRLSPPLARLALKSDTAKLRKYSKTGKAQY